MKRFYFLLAVTILLGFSNCKRNDNNKKPEAIEKSNKLDGDKMIYGLACDGCSDSVIVFLPNEGGDPVTYNIINANKKHKIFGHPEIGDWVGIMLNPKNPKEAEMVIDLDQLKGTWTYQVMPTLKSSATKTTEEIEAELTDSIKKLIFIPREYGFSLKRHYQATSVGMIFRGNSLSDESLVEYPPVPHLTEWRPYNGKLILTRDTVDKERKRIPDNLIKRDTVEFVYMLDDTLALRMDGKIIGFHRQKNAMEANKKAMEAAAKQATKDSIR